MADLTAPLVRRMRDGGGTSHQAYQVNNAETIFYGSIVGLNASGVLVNWEAAAINPGVLVGPSDGYNETNDKAGKVVGDSSGTPPPEGDVVHGVVLEDVAVTGADNQNDVGDAVYATDGNTLTLTDPTTSPPIGVFVRYTRSGFGDVRLFTPGEAAGNP